MGQILNRRRVMVGKRLPYEEVEYIQGDGNSWIDLGFGVDFLYSNDWILDFELTEIKTFVFAGINGCQLVITNEYARLDDWTGSGDNVNISKDVKFSLVQLNGYLCINNVSSKLNKSISSSPNMFLFSRNPIEASTTFTGKIYSLKVFASGTNVLLFDMVPVVKSGVPCFYDRISQTFFDNQGTGNFIAGAPQEHIEDNSIIPIEYIENSNSAFLDTGYIPTSDTVLQFKFMNLVPTGSVILGGSNEFRFFNASSGLYFDSFGGKRINVSNRILANNIYEIELGNYYAKDLTDDTIIVSSPTQYTGTGTTTLCLDGNTSTGVSKNRWYYLKIYEGNTLMKHLVPVRVGSIGYMYDMVSNSLVSPVGLFTLGPDLNS